MRRAAIALACLASLAGCGGAPASGDGLSVKTVTIDSNAVGQKLPMSVVVPEAAKDPPLLVLLHGRGQDERSFVNQDLFGALKKLGARAPAVVFPYGGDHSYFHDRADGDWGTYVMDDAIPGAVQAAGADSDRVAIGGFSMGGFGAYDLARLHPGEFCAVGGHSPAMWPTAAETPDGAFDDESDFAAHDIIGAARDKDSEAYTHERIWLDRAASDPFVANNKLFTDALETKNADLTTASWPGDHDTAYWNANWPHYLGFYADALEDCGAPDR